MSKLIYMDNAATTKVDPEVLNAMLPYFTENFGNPSSIYKIARDAQKAVEHARKQVADALGADVNEIFFTACGSESDNWAIKGAARAMKARKGKTHIITTAFEHHAVLHTVKALEREGFTSTIVGVNENGVVKPEDIRNAITDDTAIVSVMYVNNEIGTIQPIKEIAAICKEKGVLFHTDAVQAIGHIDIDVKDLGVDLLSLSAHKFNGPKGVGALYIKKGVVIENFMDGGGQERGKRAGTENTAGIVGLGVAIEKATKNIAEKNIRLREMQEKIIDALTKLPYSYLNGDREQRIAGSVNISFEGLEGESLLLMLDMHGICASSGSACTSGSLDPSHVLLAIGRTHEVAHGSLRISLNAENTMEEVDYLLSVVPQIVEKLRSMSPLWETMMKEGK